MTNRSRNLALSMAAMMVITTVVSLAPAATAQEFVPTKPEVPFTIVPGVEARMYLRYPNLGAGTNLEQNQPDCSGVGDGAANTLQISPAQPNNQDFGGRASCGYGGGGSVEFRTEPRTDSSSMMPNRDIHITGNSSLHYVHSGMVSADTPIKVTLTSGTNTIAANTFTYTRGPTDPQSVPGFDMTLRLEGTGRDTGRHTLFANQELVLKIEEQSGDNGGLGGIGAPTWRVSDVGSHLRIVADDAFRAATWVTDERSELRSVFAPIPAESQRPEDQDRRLVGHFALQSAYGYQDASRGAAPVFRLYRDGQLMEIGEGGASILTGALNQSGSAPANGTAVWSFPAGTLKYNGFQGGEYALRVAKSHHLAGGSPITAGIERTFAIAAQSIDLRVFADQRTGVGDTQAHTVFPGGSTTYVLQVNNTGAVNDTFSINLTAPNPPVGWGGLIGGPDVQGDRITVPRGETRVLTLTVTAPVGATGQIIHLVNVTSTLDPGARSRDLTLVTSVGTDVVRDVGVIFLASDVEVDPSVDTRYPVYVWNRGTLPANISLELKETSVSAWTTDLISGNNPVDRVVVGGVQPGGISPVPLRIRGDSASSPSHTIRLNATHQDVAGISREVPITFSLRSTSGVSIRVLDAIGGHGHVAELQTPAEIALDDTGETTAPNPACATVGDCTPDGIDGLWYRIWVTNNGRNQDTFTLSAELFDTSCGPGSTPALRPGDDVSGFYHRAPGVSPVEVPGSMTLDPTQTGEIYYLLAVGRNSDPCGDSDLDSERLTFVVMAQGQSGAIARQELTATASKASNGRSEAVFIEPVTRLSYDSSAPIVDIANTSKRSIIGGIKPGDTVEYYVRVTNAASWGNFTDSDDEPQESDLRLALDAINFEEGWNVSMRPVISANLMNEVDNPWKREYNLSIHESPTGARRAWVDQEIQIRVQAPSAANGTAVTNAQDTVFLTASMNNSDAKNTLEIVTIVTDFAEVNLRTDVQRVFAHAGDPTAFLLYLNNTGGSETPVTMRARPLNAPAGWIVEPNAQTFSLAAFKNRTIALGVTPPAGAPVGTTVNIEVNVSYAPFPKLGTNQTETNTTIVPVQVVGPGALQLIANTTETTVAPGGFANFTMTVRNQGNLNVPFRVTASDIPNWTITPSVADPIFGNLSAGDSRQVTLVARVPTDVTNESRFSSIVRVDELNAALGSENFDTSAVTINILGGRAIPSLSVPNLVKRVDRGSTQSFEVGIRNVGSAAGRIPLEWRALDPAWAVVVRDAPTGGQQISSVQLAPNEQVNVYLNVSAPFVVPERTVVPVEVAAYTPDLTQRATATLSAEIHDYGVSVVLSPSSKDGLPGVATEFVARVRNTGNDNDTLNLSVNLVDLVGWDVDHVEEVRLEPNQETEIRMTFRSPDDPLPTPRAYTFPVWVGTRGGQNVNISKNDTMSAVITIPNYRAFDMDNDLQLEVAVDLDKRTGNGFEEFREIFVTGVASREIGKPILDGRTTFLLDVPAPDAAHDGVADVWFNPETVHAFDITHAPDVNGDGTPDYLLDTDRDGKIDRAYDSVTERFWNVVEVKVFGDDRIQYLVDVTGDGRPDRFFDPDAAEGEGLVTRTQSAENLGSDYVGIDVDDDQTVDYYYNTRTQETSGAEVQNLGGFAQRYWYFFVIFLALVLVSVLLIVRRRR